jgi:transposase
MTDSRTLYATLLGVTEPWRVEQVEMKPEASEVHVVMALPSRTRWVCPECLASAPIHDHQERTWRHLDTCQFKTFIHARVPRLSCPTHGIQQRAVRRGLARRQLQPLRYVGADETSYQKRHEYVTVVSDLERGQVVHVADSRGQAALDAFWTSLPPAQREAVAAVAMDMWEPYIRSTRAHLPAAETKIVFDKFHVAQHLGEAVGQVRRQEPRVLMAAGDPLLKGTKYQWLENPRGRRWSQACAFNLLRALAPRVGRAWALKQAAMALWNLRYPGAADRNFAAWYGWARRSRLEPMRRAAAMLKRHWANIRTFFRHRITNAGAEAINAKIQAVKRRACGFRNRERVRTAIYFHCGGLNLYPAAARINS